MNKLLKDLIYDLDDLLQSDLQIDQAAELLEHPWRIELQQHLNSGLCLSDFFIDHHLDQQYQPLVSNLEKAGLIAQALRAVKENEQNQQALKRELLSALAYPLFVLFCCYLALLFFEFFLLPTFKDVFTSLNIEPPVLIELLKLVKFIPLALISAVILLKYFKFDLQQVLFADFQNIQILEQLRSALEYNYPLTEIFRHLPGKQQLIFYLNRGAALSTVIEKAALLNERELIQLRNAEKSCDLVNRMQLLLQNKKQKYFEKLKRYALITEPAAIILTGMIVGSICLALLTPLLQLGSSIGF